MSVLAHRVSVSFAVALARDMSTIYGRLQESFPGRASWSFACLQNRHDRPFR